MSTKINWEEQWAIHSPGFKNGFTTIPLSDSQSIQLLPGPGFGDYSHPTTKLMIEAMIGQVSGKSTFDIGCGSGVLSIAAAKSGAQDLYAIDICEEAIEHTKKNARFNDLNISFSPPKTKPVILMNMIFSEQKPAWATHCLPFDLLITSGILISNKAEYLNYANSQKWELLSQSESDGWLCFTFKDLSI